MPVIRSDKLIAVDSRDELLRHRCRRSVNGSHFYAKDARHIQASFWRIVSSKLPTILHCSRQRIAGPASIFNRYRRTMPRHYDARFLAFLAKELDIVDDGLCFSSALARLWSMASFSSAALSLSSATMEFIVVAQAVTHDQNKTS